MALPMAGGGGRIVQRGGTVVGDYMFGRQIGAGSFSVVWLARNRVRGTEVAVKEIIMEKLSPKLHDSLLSEIVILKKIDHPNIIGLHDIIKESGRIFIVLEYCKGGDLSLYIRHHGRLPVATAKHFMRQLACGLKVLRDNNLIHRDLKPQNLLLSRNDESAVLKIADFGFARSLDDELAETVCGSPLYMAPEIMKMKKYDAKADLWSIGTILFQLVTGKTPFSGNSQLQLIHNIENSTGLHFPRDNADLSSDCIDLCQKLLRRNPVERLTFEEFFNHPFLLQSYQEESFRSGPSSSEALDDSPLTTDSHARPSDENSQEDCLPFILDGVSKGPDARISMPNKNSSVRPTYGFSVDPRVDKRPVSHSNKIITPSSCISKHDQEGPSAMIVWEKPSHGNLKESKLPIEQRPSKASSEDPSTVDSLEFILAQYVVVPGTPFESSSLCPSRLHNSSCESESSSLPMAIIGAATSKNCGTESLETNHCSPTSGTSQGSVDMRDAMEQPSSHCMTRIRSLQQCAFVVTELVKERIDLGKRLEAFSVQLVILAMWKQALHICHAQAVEGSPSQEMKLRGSMNKKETLDSRECISSNESQHPDSAQIERAFLEEIENAEALTRDIGQVDDTTEMPDAMEIIFQSALSWGRNGAVDELMDNTERAAILYSKAVQLLYFLLVEAPLLILNPPFSLTNSDKLRLQSYIEILNNRQSQYRSQRMAFLENDTQQSL